MGNVLWKLVPGPFLILVNSPKQSMHETLENKATWKRISKKLTWFFSLHPVPYYGKDYEIKKGPRTNY